MRERWQSFKGIVELWVDLFAEHDLLTYASAIAFQSFIAVVAFSLLALGILGATHDTGIWQDSIGPAIHHRVLEGIYAAADQTVHKVFRTSSAGLIAFASALAVWEVSGVVRASMGTLNRIYDTGETRPWWIRFPLSFALAAALVASVLGALLLVWFVGDVRGAWHVPLLLVRWVAAVVLLVVGFGLLVRFAPVDRRAGRWVSAGALLVVVAWIVETLVFRWYVTSLANFKTAIGSLTLFIVASSYLYVAAIILIVAMELDELVREDLQLAESRQRLLPLVTGVIRGTA